MRDIFLRLVVGGLLGLLVNPLTVVHAQADNDQSKLDAVDSAVSGLSQAELMEAMTLTSRAFRSADKIVLRRHWLPLSPTVVFRQSRAGSAEFENREREIRPGS